MRDLSINELIDLVVSEVPESESKIEKMFEWHFQRNMTITTWLLGVAASLFISVLVALFKSELKLPLWQTIIVFICNISTATYGIYRLWHIRSMHRQFVSALKILSGLKKISPFLLLYSRERR